MPYRILLGGVFSLLLSITLLENSYAALICATPPAPGSWDLADNAQIDIPITFDVGDTATIAYTVTQASVKITHTYAWDLWGKLLTPDGTIAHLWQLGDGTVAPSTPTASNCNKGWYDMVFQDTGGGPILKQSNQWTYCIGTNLDTKVGSTTGWVGSPYVFSRSAPASIGVRGSATPINLLSTLAGHSVFGTWNMRVKDSYAADVGTVTQSCVDITYAGLGVNFYVSANATCSDKLSSKIFNEWQIGYLCYSVANKWTETFEVRAGNATNTAGMDFSSFDHAYTVRDTMGSTGTVISSFIAGTWLFTAGTHIFTGSALVHGTDINFNSTGTLLFSKSVSITILDVTAPLAPTIITAGSDSVTPFITNDNTPTITGTGEANTLITIKNGSGITIGTGMTNGSGAFAIIFPMTLDGTRNYTMINTDASGNVSVATPFALTIDTSAPVAPTITSIGWDIVVPFLTTDSTPIVMGTGELNSLITLTDGSGMIIGTGMTDGSGNYIITTTTIFPDGLYGVSTMSTDAVGNMSSLRISSFTIDTIAPITPTISSPTDNTLLSDTTPVLTGTGESNTVFTLTSSMGAMIGTGSVDGSGNWILTLTAPLSEGSNTLSIVTTDIAGNTSPSTSVTLLIDSLPPVSPTVSNVAGDTTAIYLTNNTTPTITGTAEAGSIIIITDASGTILGTITTDVSGNWTLTLSSPLPEGLNSLTATATDTTGNISTPLSLPVQIDITAPATPTIANPTNGLITNDNTPTINGTGEPGNIFIITDGSGNIIGTGTVNPRGNYSFTPTSAFPDGSTVISVTTMDVAGNMSISASSTIMIDTAAPPPLTIVWPIYGSITSDNTPSILWTGEPLSVFTIRDVWNNILSTGSVDMTGNYSFTPISTFPDGSTTYAVTLTDLAGNMTSTMSTVFTIDTIAPVIAYITTPLNGSSSNNYTPTIQWTGEPNSTFIIRDGSSNIIGTGVVDTLGNYIFPYNTPLADGYHTISVTLTDLAGNISLAVSTRFLVDTVAPVTPTISSVAGDMTVSYITNDNTPTITGTGEPNTIFLIRDVSGGIIASGSVDASGSYSHIFAPALADGNYIYTITTTDVVGNISSARALPIIIDTLSPTAPSILAPMTGSATNNHTPTLTWTGEPNAIFIVSNSLGGILATGSVDASWNYIFTPIVTLPDGSNTYRVELIDPAGNISSIKSTTFHIVTIVTGGWGGGGSSSANNSNVSISAPIPPTPVMILPNTTVSNTANSNLFNTNTRSISIQPASSIITLSAQQNNINLVGFISGTTFPIYEIKNRITDYICPRIVKMYDVDSVLAGDIPTNKFSEDIQSVVMFRGLEQDEEKNIQPLTDYQNSGIALNTISFDPSRDITRAEFVKMLVRSLSCHYKSIGTDSWFPDVDKDKWYAEYITFAVKNGWMNWYADGMFHPNSPISRWETAKILARAIELANPKTTTTVFDDVPDTSIFAPYVESLKNSGIFQWKSVSIFAPDQHIPRTEVSRIIYRTFLGGKK
jgi:subtilisin-like proprotein convertase family protein